MHSHAQHKHTHIHTLKDTTIISIYSYSADNREFGNIQKMIHPFTHTHHWHAHMLKQSKAFAMLKKFRREKQKPKQKPETYYRDCPKIQARTMIAHSMLIMRQARRKLRNKPPNSTTTIYSLPSTTTIYYYYYLLLYLPTTHIQQTIHPAVKSQIKCAYQKKNMLYKVLFTFIFNNITIVSTMRAREVFHKISCGLSSNIKRFLCFYVCVRVCVYVVCACVSVCILFGDQNWTTSWISKGNLCSIKIFE